MTVGAVIVAYQALAGILNRRPTLPQTGHYRLARMYNALKEEGETAEQARVKLVMELGSERTDAEGKLTGAWEVPEKGAEGKDTEVILLYREQWKTIRDQEIEINVQPVSITVFGDHENGLQGAELALLGELITD